MFLIVDCQVVTYGANILKMRGIQTLPMRANDSACVSTPEKVVLRFIKGSTCRLWRLKVRPLPLLLRVTSGANILKTRGIQTLPMRANDSA